ncbi:hypothetical protein Sango_2089400 [Sesamum angolense]|uniref:Uncharacterized protein n=1 Tax=Sesamum angolense TaxID=2727404 RepID=A0AAE2BLY0_9LAMI|nr:hypothetical protein Sango_2089400 [Sesamum angolense]
MLYWKDDVDLEYCKFCRDARYKPSRGRNQHQKKSPYAVLRYLSITPHLQRLYYSRATVEHMMWHATPQIEKGSMCHPSNAEVWKYFDRMYPDFAEELRNVRLALCTDDFAPQELLQLWHVSVRTYDHDMNLAFIMRAALMWIVNDLPTYGMTFGWSSTGVIGYPICIGDTRAFYFQHNRKACYFDCHRQFLLAHHSYRRNKKSFMKNRVENKVTRPRLTGDQILDRVANISPTVEMPLLLLDGYGRDYKWTEKRIF